MEYPKTIKLESEELKSLIEEKSKLVNEGRAKSEEIEQLDAKMEDIEKELIAEEKKVDLKEFLKKEKSITKRMEKCIVDINKIKEEIYTKIRENTPQKIRDKYDEAKKQKEEKETERNKIALSVQKFNDKIIPLSRELMTPYLTDSFDDFDTIMIKDGELIATIFNHIEEFKINFNKTRK